MKYTTNRCDFHDRFRNMGRLDNFSYEGRNALFDYLEEYEESCDTEIELDVIALCCEYTEYESIEEFHGVYDEEEYPDLETLWNYTQVIEIPDTEGFIICDF